MRWSLLCLLWLCWGTALSQAQGQPGREGTSRLRFVAPEKRWALIVGVSEYQNLPKNEWLLSGHKDAVAIADFLRSPRGGGTPDSHLRLLINEEATLANIQQGLKFLSDQVGPGDVATIFFAGHGTVDREGRREAAYLLPFDADPNRLQATALGMDDLAEHVDGRLPQAAQVVLITDACHSGGLLSRGPMASILSRRSINEVVQLVGQRDGVLNLTACRRDEVAVEDPRLGGHGVLTYSVLKALNGAANATPNGIVRNQELLEYVMRHVPRLTEQQQHPRHGVDYTDGFPLANLNLPGPAYQVPEEPAELAATSDSAFAWHSRATLRVVGSTENSNVYLVQGAEQRHVGRPITGGSVLVADGLRPGTYRLVVQSGAKSQEWPIELSPGTQTFDLRSGGLR